MARTPVLEAKGSHLTLDPASLSQTDLDHMRSVRAEEWTLRGVIAVNADWLLDRNTALADADVPRPLGAKVEGVWYFVSPIHSVPNVERDQVIVVLYR
ncbi:hypothetical protein GCM10010842_38350 [Deinococcus daejeonensis]|uniref:Uncharacterized protein n=1 Tax=Deinococcus daejeonensis TaxID=1007098 RepID=A0ABQ2JJD8_9DEIO|nr:hypothetical protein GCM10010842_38350 [Deinococcus daejeonensis]